MDNNKFEDDEQSAFTGLIWMATHEHAYKFPHVCMDLHKILVQRALQPTKPTMTF